MVHGCHAAVYGLCWAFSVFWLHPEHVYASPPRWPAQIYSAVIKYNFKQLKFCCHITWRIGSILVSSWADLGGRALYLGLIYLCGAHVHALLAQAMAKHHCSTDQSKIWCSQCTLTLKHSRNWSGISENNTQIPTLIRCSSPAFKAWMGEYTAAQGMRPDVWI